MSVCMIDAGFTLLAWLRLLARGLDKLPTVPGRGQVLNFTLSLVVVTALRWPSGGFWHGGITTGCPGFFSAVSAR